MASGKMPLSRDHTRSRHVSVFSISHYSILLCRPVHQITPKQIRLRPGRNRLRLVSVDVSSYRPISNLTVLLLSLSKLLERLVARQQFHFLASADLLHGRLVWAPGPCLLPSLQSGFRPVYSIWYKKLNSKWNPNSKGWLLKVYQVSVTDKQWCV